MAGHRHSSAALNPAGCSFSTPMLCSSVNLLRFMSVSFAGEQTNLKVPTFQGRRSMRKGCPIFAAEPQTKVMASDRAGDGAMVSKTCRSATRKHVD